MVTLVVVTAGVIILELQLLLRMGLVLEVMEAPMVMEVLMEPHPQEHQE
jgi:hypothetical protein